MRSAGSRYISENDGHRLNWCFETQGRVVSKLYDALALFLFLHFQPKHGATIRSGFEWEADMRRIVLLLVVALMAVAGPAAAGKIGFVDAERAVVEVKEGLAKIKALEAWAKPQQQAIEAASSRVNEIRQQIAQQRPVASPETLERLGRDEVEARRIVEDAKRNFERDLSTKQEQFLGDVAVKVGTVASEFGKANGYDAIMVIKAQPIIYLAEEADLTDTIIRLYDQRFPVK